MANTETTHLDALLHDITQRQGEDFTYDRASIEQESQHSAFHLKSLAIKALTILGGFLAASTFLGFLGAAGLYESGVAMMVVGVMFLVGAEWLIQHKKDAMADSIGVSFNLMGYLLLAIGVGQLTESTSAVCGVLACAAVLVLLFSESAICVFVSVLVLNGSLLGLIYDNKVYNVAHGLVVLLAAVLTYMSLYEAKLITASPKVNLKYRPVRMGVVFSLVVTLALFVHQKFLSSQIEHFWISSLFLIACFLYLVYHVMKDAAITNIKTQAAFYTCCVLLLAPTILTPSIPGALLVLLSSFYIGHRPGFWVGLLALVYFVILYYYDLNMTLLAKSGVLVASGLLFLGGFVLLNKFLKSYAD
ncbi:DUF4401 domain-containing protein [Pontibacter cellulosilyticus]|uniref:DUF4401 domain-containing protein n=1 Tax=Pontibacter cellulosilyticus TaxID=1720253 RepID=A0A923N6L0_9BACT|nr:DUF4401 domain-containing protein [Pontibacter cellulosilyticus]MBC5992744.1 DUF4401 domain-containing protein [Pontibacter cellulosilyticus]